MAPPAGSGSALTVLANGSVGIQTTSPAFTLEVGGLAGKPGGGAWSVASDRRLKRNVRDLEGSLERLLRLRGRTFEYRDPESLGELPGERVGVVAQEVEAVFPDWVEVSGTGYRAVTFRGFEALFAEALEELREEQDARLARLHEELARLRELEDRLGAVDAARLRRESPDREQ